VRERFDQSDMIQGIKAHLLNRTALRIINTAHSSERGVAMKKRNIPVS